MLFIFFIDQLASPLSFYFLYLGDSFVCKKLSFDRGKKSFSLKFSQTINYETLEGIISFTMLSLYPCPFIMELFNIFLDEVNNIHSGQ